MPTTKLARYQEKRDFRQTAEPSGNDRAVPSDALRFVIQKHAASHLHFDLRLEHDGTFASWAVPKGPSLDPKERRLAMQVEDHPLDYGDFEGTIPKGQYGGGTVMLWDRGYWAPEPGFEDVAAALAKGELKFVMRGDRVGGSWVLVRTRRDERGRANWILIKHRDDAAVPGNLGGPTDDDHSVASGRTMAEIAAGAGHPAKPFMTEAGAPAGSVWHSNRNSDGPAGLVTPPNTSASNSKPAKAAVVQASAPAPAKAPKRQASARTLDPAEASVSEAPEPEAAKNRASARAPKSAQPAKSKVSAPETKPAKATEPNPDAPASGRAKAASASTSRSAEATRPTTNAPATPAKTAKRNVTAPTARPAKAAKPKAYPPIPEPGEAVTANVTAPTSEPAKAAAPNASASNTGPLKAAQLPPFVEPQLTRSVDKPPAGPGWAHEIKFDGYRMQLRTQAGRATLLSRRALDWSAKFPEIVAAGAHLPDGIIDGEVVALDHHGSPDFAALQAAISDAKTANLVFFVFDQMFAGQEDLRPLPLTDRKARLQATIELAPANIRYVDHFVTGGDAVLLSACRMHLEGIVSKRLDAPYQSGRVETWTKAKCRAGHEVVLGGYATTKGAFRSLIAGVNRDGHLVHVGRIGTGFSRDTVARILPRLQAMETDTSPFTAGGPRKTADIHWLRPELVAEIEYEGFTGDGHLRQAAFKGLREDKPAEEVEADSPAPADTPLATPTPASSSRPHRSAAAAPHKSASPASASPAPVSRRPDPPGPASTRSTPNAPASPAPAPTSPAASGTVRSSAPPHGSAPVMGVMISHADKPLWPDAHDNRPVTKLDLARYYEAVGFWLIRHVRGRPCSMIRMPDGIGGAQNFFQRHAAKGQSSLIEEVTVWGDRKPYVQFNRIEALVAAAQVGALELHPWNNQPNLPEQPGRLVFDLDPAPDVAFDQVIAAAREIRDRLDRLGLVSFCKTTGGKGLHVVTPLDGAGVDWAAAKAFAMNVCKVMAADAPDRYLINMAKKQRTGRIFLDYLRNDRMATAVAPLSPRGRPGAPVSMPVHWAQVKKGLDPQKYTIRTVPGDGGQADRVGGLLRG